MHRELIESLGSEDRVMILGYGVTGTALARFFDNKSISYFVYNDGKIDGVGPGFVGHVTSNDSIDLFSNHKIKAIFPSPGVSLAHPMVQKAKTEKVPVIGELELASFYLKGDFIAVTGTNGKSTTVKLIEALLKDAGLNVSLKGNIGSPLITAVNEPPASFYVIEESSYQLELVGSLWHKIAVCLNVSDDHLDRYSSLESYGAAKEKIVKNSQEDDLFVYNADDKLCAQMARRSRARCLPYSLVNHPREGGFANEKQMVIRLAEREFLFELADCSLVGLHNIENMLAALLVVLDLKNDEPSVESYRKTLKNFEGLAHRLQKVHTEQGVDYFDDSKATNVGAVVMALASFDRPIVLIAGGRDKEGDYSPLTGLVKGKVKNLILLGEAKERMKEAFQGLTEVVLVDDMKAAVRLAKELVESGDVVLLSPACSSFDQYPNFKERGLDFQRLVKL